MSKLTKRFFAAFGVVLIVLAVGIGVFRLLVTQLPSSQGEIQTWAREVLGLSVNFTGLDARLGVLGPELTFHNASVSRVGDESNPILSATEARLGLNMVAFFSNRQLEARRLTLQGTSLNFERTLDGTLRFQYGTNDGLDRFVLEELPPVSIVVSDSKITYQDRIQQSTWEFQDVRAELTRGANNIFLEASARASEKLGGRIEFSVEANLLDEESEAQRDWRLSWPSGEGIDIRAFHDETGLFALEFTAEFVQLEDLLPLLPMLPDSEVKRVWAELRPVGELGGVDIRLSRRLGESWDYSVAGSFDDLEVSSLGRWPGLMGVSGEVRADSRSGRLDLYTRDARVDWPTLFPLPLEAEELSGILVWRQGRDGLRLVSDDLVLNNRDALTRTTLEFTYPMDGTSPVLELESLVTGFNVGALARYLPAEIMPPGVVRYLEQAVLGGHASQADVTFFGPLQEFPFDNGGGEFSAHVQIENASMSYVENWPAATDLTGTIDFLNAGWLAQGFGQVLGNKSEKVRVGIKDLRDPVLTVAAETIGPLENVVLFLKDAPLIAQHLGANLMRVNARGGTGKVVFDLSLPLLDRSAYSLSSTLEVVDGEISVDGFAPTASEISGILTLEDGGWRGEGIAATLFEGPITVAVSHPEGSGYIANISFDGEMNVEGAYENFPLPLKDYVAGQTRWQGSLLLPATTYTRMRGEPLRLSVRSNLSGVTLQLPEPFNKTSDELTDFQLNFVFSESDRLDISGHLGTERRFALSFRNRDGELSFRRGNVRFGGNSPLLPPRDGLTINGILRQLRLEEWSTLLDEGPTLASLSSLFSGADLEIADLSAFDQNLGHTQLAIRQEAAQWHLDVESQLVTGTITMPLDLADRPQIFAEMERLNISTENVVAVTDRDPRRLPGLLLTAEQFSVGERRFGVLNADIRADPLGLKMESFQTESDSFVMEGSGSWFDGNQGPETRLELSMSSGDVATTLEQLGLDPVTEGAGGDVTLSVHWPDSPSADWAQSISGDLALRLEQGSVLNLEPGAGRMMGLMSITALPRRLALDFRDVFNRGLVFDEVNGDFRIINGDAYTDNLYLTGPVADIGIVGRTGLSDQDYQQQAVVTAEPGKILPTMGFLAGPQVGAALLIFTQLFKESLRGIGRASYCVTGNWYEPSVERLTPTELQRDEICADLPPISDVATQ
jgi:uncharacterized protein (TIGR02099 family)